MDKADELMKITEDIRSLSEEQFEMLVDELLKQSMDIEDAISFRKAMRRWYEGKR